MAEELKGTADHSDDFNEGLDADIQFLANLFSQTEAGVSVMLPGKVDQVDAVREAMEHIVKGKRVHIITKLNEPYLSMGSVSVIGRKLKIIDPALFVKAVWLGSNMEVYPKLDGSIQINIAFDGLTRKVAESDDVL